MFMMVLCSPNGFLALVQQIFIKTVVFEYLLIAESFCFLPISSNYNNGVAQLAVRKCAIEDSEYFLLKAYRFNGLPLSC